MHSSASLVSSFIFNFESVLSIYIEIKARICISQPILFFLFIFPLQLNCILEDDAGKNVLHIVTVFSQREEERDGFCCSFFFFFLLDSSVGDCCCIFSLPRVGVCGLLYVLFRESKRRLKCIYNNTLSVHLYRRERERAEEREGESETNVLPFFSSSSTFFIIYIFAFFCFFLPVVARTG